MTGAFGLLGHPQSDLVPTERLVEHCPMLDVFALWRRRLGYTAGNKLAYFELFD